MTIFTPLAKSNFLVTFEKVGTFLWTEKSGGDVEVESSEYANGTGNAIYKLTGPRKISNITLKAPYDPRYTATLEPIFASYDCTPGRIIVQPVGCSGAVGSTITSNVILASTFIAPSQLNLNQLIISRSGDPTVYSGCRLVKYKPPEVDRKSADAAMLEVEFVVNQAQFGTGTYNPEAADPTTQDNVSAGLDFLSKILKGTV